jgi:hypothetical protein
MHTVRRRRHLRVFSIVCLSVAFAAALCCGLTANSADPPGRDALGVSTHRSGIGWESNQVSSYRLTKIKHDRVSGAISEGDAERVIRSWE